MYSQLELVIFFCFGVNVRNGSSYPELTNYTQPIARETFHYRVTGRQRLISARRNFLVIRYSANSHVSTAQSVNRICQAYKIIQ